MPSRPHLKLCSRVMLHLLLAFGCLRAQDLRAQDPPPAQPFQAVHLLWIDVAKPNAEDTVRSAIAGLNQAITKAGCPECTYRLWKVVDAAPGSYNYVQASNWPSGAVYDKIHNSPEYITASKNWESIRSIVTRETYNRYIEEQLSNGSTTKPATAAPTALVPRKTLGSASRGD